MYGATRCNTMSVGGLPRECGFLAFLLVAALLVPSPAFGQDTERTPASLGQTAPGSSPDALDGLLGTSPTTETDARNSASGQSPGRSTASGTSEDDEGAAEFLSDAEAQRLHLLELARNGEQTFLWFTRHVGSTLPRGAVVVFSAPGMDPLFRESLTRELVRSRKVKVLAGVDGARWDQDVQAAIPAPAGDGGSAEAEDRAVSNLTERRAVLSSDNLLVLPGTERAWPTPDFLFTVTPYDSPDFPTAWSLSGSMLEKSSKTTCFAIQTLRANSGVVDAQYLQCVDGKGVEVAVREALRHTCQSHPLVVVLPMSNDETHAAGEDPFGPGGAQRAYFQVLDALNDMGCRIQDIPSGTPGVQQVENQDKTRALGWRYNPRLKAVVRPAAFEKWEDGDVSVTILATKRQLPAGELVERLSEVQDRALIDPDLQGLPESKTVQFIHLAIEAVHVGTGEELLVGSVVAGMDTPRDIIASAVVDLLVGGRSRGWLEVHRVPSDGVLELDRKATPVTPGAQLVELSKGRHRLELRLAGKRVNRTKVRIQPATYSVTTVAVPFGWLDVTSHPKGATIEVDGESWGPAPVERSISAGRHALVARIDGCGEVGDSKLVNVGDKESIKLYLPGTIKANVVPADAWIYVDGKKVGQGTIDIEAPYGQHTLEFRLEGFETQTVQVDVDSCQQSEASHTFFGRLEVAAVPSKARVRVDGKVIGKAPVGKYFLAGKHEARCDWCEYGRATESTTLEPGRVREMKLTVVPARFSVDLGPELRLMTDGSPVGIGLRVAGWYNGRAGLTAMVGLRKNANAYSLNENGILLDGAVFGSIRLLAPGPGWTLPLSGGVQFVQDGDTTRVLPAFRADLRECLGGGTVLDLGATFGIPIDTGKATFMLHAGFNWQSALKW